MKLSLLLGYSWVKKRLAMLWRKFTLSLVKDLRGCQFYFKARLNILLIEGDIVWLPLIIIEIIIIILELCKLYSIEEGNCIPLLVVQFSLKNFIREQCKWAINFAVGQPCKLIRVFIE